MPCSCSVSHRDPLPAAALPSSPSAQAPPGFPNEPLPSLAPSGCLPPSCQHSSPPALCRDPVASEHPCGHRARPLAPNREVCPSGGQLLSGGHKAILFWKLQASRALDLRCRGKGGLGGACLGAGDGLAGIAGRGSPGKAALAKHGS